MANPEESRRACSTCGFFLRARRLRSPTAARLGLAGARARLGPDHGDRLARARPCRAAPSRTCSTAAASQGRSAGALAISLTTRSSSSLGISCDLGAGPRRRLVQVAVHQHDGRGPSNGGLPGQHLVEHDPQGVQVGLVADRRRAADLLGGHVGRRAQRPARWPSARSASRSLAIPKSVSLSLPSSVTIRFDGLRSRWTTPVLVGVVQRVAELDPQLDHLAPGQLPRSWSIFSRVDALDVLHGEVRRPLEPAPGQEPDDVGMAELLEDLGLALEPVEDLALLGELAVDDLDGGRPSGRLVRRPVDHPHRAGAQDLLEAERTQLLADRTPDSWSQPQPCQLPTAPTPSGRRGPERHGLNALPSSSGSVGRRSPGSSDPGHRARQAAGRRQVAVLDVVHHHPVGVEPPGQGPEARSSGGRSSRGAGPMASRS